MKKIVNTLLVFAFTLIALCACSDSDNELSTSPSSASSQESLSQQTSVEEKILTEETVLTEKQLDFWESECGKEILKWCDEPNLYTKALSGDFVLYYCEGTVYLKNKDGNIEEIIDQVNIAPSLITFGENELCVPFESGIWRYGIGNFPYNYVYNVETGTAKKEMWPLNTSSKHHTVIGNTMVKAQINRVDIMDGVASIYFDIDLNEQQGDADSFFPKIDYFYNNTIRRQQFI